MSMKNNMSFCKNTILCWIYCCRYIITM